MDSVWRHRGTPERIKAAFLSGAENKRASLARDFRLELILASRSRGARLFVSRIRGFVLGRSFGVCWVCIYFLDPWSPTSDLNFVGLSVLPNGHVFLISEFLGLLVFDSKERKSWCPAIHEMAVPTEKTGRVLKMRGRENGGPREIRRQKEHGIPQGETRGTPQGVPSS